MSTNDPNELSLEPMDSAKAAEKHQSRAKFFTDNRDHEHPERRTHPDRRQEVRFTADRRSGKDRRAGSASWDDQHRF